VNESWALKHSPDESERRPRRRPQRLDLSRRRRQVCHRVFADSGPAFAWIAKHRLTGVLTEYPLGDGCYDIALRKGYFVPTRTRHGSPTHVAGFSPSRAEPLTST
jgi:hypothetical protein